MRDNGAIRLSLFTRGFGRRQDDRGVYAILYAILIVVMVVMAGFALDIASARADRRVDKSAADSAVLAALQAIDPNSVSGIDPYAACQAAWKYLSTSIDGITDHSSAACQDFKGLDTSTLCASAPPYQTPVLVTTPAENEYTIQMEWPVPQYVAPFPATFDPVGTNNPFLQSDLAPKTTANNQLFSSTVDGSGNGCDRFGVAVAHHREFGISAGVGSGGTTTMSHSVARLNPNGGPLETVAALNVLNPKDCEALHSDGGGVALVGPSLDANGNVVSGGTIAVESSGLGICNSSQYAIDPSTAVGTLICSSLTTIDTGCDGKGVIESYAVDKGGRAYPASAIPSNLRPTPIGEGSQHGWGPVTKLYGCDALPTSPSDSSGTCSVDGTNYISDLSAALQGPAGSAPTKYYADSVAPYTFPSEYSGTTSFATPSPATGFSCAIKSVVVIPAGNVYLPCTTLSISTGGVLVLQGGTVVVEGAISVSNGCLIVNVPLAASPAPTCVGVSISGTRGSITTSPAPYSDAILYLRNNGCGKKCGFGTSGSGGYIMPQTFVFSNDTSDTDSPLNVTGTGPALWTAPGTGPTVGGMTPLEQRCYVAATKSVSQDCLNSRFSRLTYWSEYTTRTSTPDAFTGQGTLRYAGVFFTPRGAFKWSGGASGSAAAAQFWADSFWITGGANFSMEPDDRFAIKSPTSTFALIR